MGERFVETGHAFLDSRSQFSFQLAAADHGCDDVVSGAFDATIAGYGLRTGQDDAVHATDVSGVPVQLFGWLDGVLDRAEFAQYRSDEINAHDNASRDTRPRSSLDAASEKEEIGRRQSGA